MWIRRSCCCLLRPNWSMCLGTVRVRLGNCARTLKKHVITEPSKTPGSPSELDPWDTGDLKKLRWIIDIMTPLVSSPFPCPVLEKRTTSWRTGSRPETPTYWMDRVQVEGYFHEGPLSCLLLFPSGLISHSGIVKQFVDVTVNSSR